MELTTQNPPPNPIEKFLGGVLKAIPLVQIIVCVAMAIGAYYVSTQTSAYAQNTRIDALEKRADAQELQNNKMLTRELYEAYHSGDAARLSRIEETLKRIEDADRR